jgi:hypothetical protein
MRQTILLNLVLLAGVTFASQSALFAQAVLNVVINTTSLVGHSAGPFSFGLAFTDGSGFGDGNNTVVVNNFSYGGGSSLGGPELFGGATGSLETGVTLTDSSFLSLLSEQFTPGNQLSFSVTWTSNDDVGFYPDRLTFYIFESSGVPLRTLAPAADYFFGIDLSSTNPIVSVYGSDPSRPPTVGNPISIGPPTVVFLDTTPPVIVPQITGTLGNNGWYRSNVTVNWSVSDPESGIASSSGCSTTTLTADTAGVTLTCSPTNGAGLSSSVPVTIKIDKTPPTISGMPALGCTLWPPNHKLVQVATVTAADALSGLAPGSFAVTGISNELSDPNDPQIIITPNGSGGLIVQLQADRLGSGTGRVYTLTAAATDLAGNTAKVVATCTVPHDQGH